MIKAEFKVPLYGTTVTLIQVEGPSDEAPVGGYLRSLGIPSNDEDYLDTMSAIRNQDTNGGDTYRNMARQRIVVIFYPFMSESRKAEVFSHEKRHIEDRIMEWHKVNDIESSGLLAGFLGPKFVDFWRKTPTPAGRKK